MVVVQLEVPLKCWADVIKDAAFQVRSPYNSIH